MKILTETLETKDLNIVDALILIDSSIKSLTETRNNSTLINELIPSAKSFCLKLDIDFDGDFNQHHRKRLKPKKNDSNQQSHVNLTYEDFYRKEFLQVLDTLIGLSSEDLKSCLKKHFPYFQKNCDMSNATDFNSALCEINILRLQTENLKSLANIMDVANKLRTLIPMANELCRLGLALTSPVTTASNERCFSKLKLIKNHLRTTMTSSRLNDLIILDSEKDILDNIEMTNMASLKERKISV
ncbi:unnamed protein product [Macrosiphum euphorbiae]|nr:unnamed protein product [Macrosiphum euphorbiae]